MGTYKEIAEAFQAGESVCVAFDLETTGLDPRQDRIAEIGAIKFDKLGPIARFSLLVDPGIPMPPEAAKVNGISDEMLAGQPKLDAVFSDFLSFIDGALIVAHNAPFDCGFIDSALTRYSEAARRFNSDKQASLILDADCAKAESAETINFTPPYSSLPNQIVDTRLFAKEAFPGRPRYSLQDLAAALGIIAKDAHRAADDARVCMELFLKCVEAV